MSAMVLVCSKSTFFPSNMFSCAQNKALQTLSDPQVDNLSKTTANANLANIQAKFSALMNMQETQKGNNKNKSKYPDGGTVLPKGADFFKANMALQQAERNKILAAHPEARQIWKIMKK